MHSLRSRRPTPIFVLAAALLAGCEDGLAELTAPSLEPSAATAAATPELILSNFENGGLGGWQSWTAGRATVALKVVSPGAAGSRYSLQAKYTAPSTALVQKELSSPADWRIYSGLEFHVNGRGTGNTIRFEIKDNGTSTGTAEIFEYQFKDDFTGWKHFSLGWDSFKRRADWQPTGAPNDGFNRGAIWGYRFSPLSGSGTFAVDELKLTLVVNVEPAPVPAPAPAPVPPVLPTPPAVCDASGAVRLVNVATASQLNNALANAQPGDFIRLADGTYSGTFTTRASGTAASRITLCGSSLAVLRGASLSGGHGLQVIGSYWDLEGFTVSNSLSGVVITSGNYNVLDGLTVEGIGQEAVSFEIFSSYNVIQNSRIRNTGLHIAEYGEGVYIGSYRGTWAAKTGGRPDASDYNRVINNVFGPDVRSEHVDVKEGTTGGIISGNTFNGAGMVRSQSWVDSWVELKGNGYTVSANTGTGTPNDGFQAFVELTGWGQNNTFTGNKSDLGGAAGYAIRITAPANIVRCDNSVVNGGVVTNIACQ